MDLSKVVQIAMLGEVPPTLRFLYVDIEDRTLFFQAVFSVEASDEHLECASVIATEVIAACPSDTKLEEVIERNSQKPWRLERKSPKFLRYGELCEK
jgi:hypothetical protein